MNQQENNSGQQQKVGTGLAIEKNERHQVDNGSGGDHVSKYFIEVAKQYPGTPHVTVSHYENNKTVEDVVKAIFYSPATNGQAENSIRNGVKLINELLHQSNQDVVALIEKRIRDIEGNGHTVSTVERVRELTDLLTQITR